MGCIKYYRSTLGGGILEIATWHWLFFINIPIAIIAIILVIFTFHFPEEEIISKTNFDVKGLSLFYVFIGLLMFSLLNQNQVLLNVLSLLLALLIGYILYKVEKTTDHPFLPVVEFNKSIALVFITDLLIAICLMGFNLYIPVYLQEQIGLSPLQSGFVIFPLSVAWIILNFNLAKLEAKFSRKALYIGAFTFLIIGSIIIIFGIKTPLLIAFSFILAGLSFGFVYTKDSVIVQEETSPHQMKKMMSYYALTKNLGSSIGSTVMGYMYAMKAGWFGSNLHNVLGLAIIIAIVLVALWSFIYKNKPVTN